MERARADIAARDVCSARGLLASNDGGYRALIGGLFGFAGGLVTPWVKWAAKRRQLERDYRIATIQQCRQALGRGTDFDISEFLNGGAWAALRAYVDDETRRSVESGTTAIVPAEGRGDDGRLHVLQDAIAKVEREWGLLPKE